jgi:hypothetical protein
MKTMGKWLSRWFGSGGPLGVLQAGERVALVPGALIDFPWWRNLGGEHGQG